MRLTVTSNELTVELFRARSPFLGDFYIEDRLDNKRFDIELDFESLVIDIDNKIVVIDGNLVET